MTAPSTKTELVQLIDRVKRQTTSPDVLDVCDAAMRAMVRVGELQALLNTQSNAVKRPKFNRRAYMQAYMKRRRAARRPDPMDQPIA